MRRTTQQTFSGYELGQSTENNKALLFFSGKETIQTFNGSISVSHHVVVCEVINLWIVMFKKKTGGDSHMKRAEMLVVSLRCVNFRFWSRLGCSGKNPIIFSRKGLFYGCTRRNIKKYIYFFNSFYLLYSCNQSL